MPGCRAAQSALVAVDVARPIWLQIIRGDSDSVWLQHRRDGLLRGVRVFGTQRQSSPCHWISCGWRSFDVEQHWQHRMRSVRSSDGVHRQRYSPPWSDHHRRRFQLQRPHRKLHIRLWNDQGTRRQLMINRCFSG